MYSDNIKLVVTLIVVINLETLRSPMAAHPLATDLHLISFVKLKMEDF